MKIVMVETLEALRSTLTNLPIGTAVYITADDFKTLTGDDLAGFVSEGRFMIGNLAARTRCTVVTTDERAIFTKNPPPIRPTPQGRHNTAAFLSGPERAGASLSARPCSRRGRQRTVPPRPALSHLPGCEAHPLQAPQCRA